MSHVVGNGSGPAAGAGESGSGELLRVAGESPESLYALLADRGWGDGLPVVAPTPARVEAMLAACGPGLDPDEVIGVLPPRLGEATPRLLAVNAVLAGCTPDLMPLLVAAVRGITAPQFNLRGVNSTTHPVSVLVIVHGEAVHRCGFNAGAGTLGPGNRANATLGRAMRLVLLHIAGGTAGSGDAATHGQPSKYTYCLAENAAAGPWPAYPHTVGVDASSAVTVAGAENPHNLHDMETRGSPVPLLDKAASVMATLGANNAVVSSAEFFVVLGPEHAATVAAAGWSRQDVQAYLYEKCRRPAGELRAHFGSALWSPWLRALRDEDLQPLTDSPQNIRLLVAGGPGKHSLVVPSWGLTRSVTVPVALPYEECR
ncbi:hypothetical protein [Streptomyces sp. CB03238]|uniref:hypothetical protein n=1 Tax=Streptomyces sp. CB03238 TaxID=1907777 RepID=UPI000A0FF130|nr:hypothetical protein [Streptomyces sp. CB03238]ORT57575.1 hypothetical protein BKD26_23350 [Streptomyces sp. CB03238]